MQVWIDLSQVICRRKLSGIPHSSGKHHPGAQAGCRDADRDAKGDAKGRNKRILSFYHYLFVCVYLYVFIHMCPGTHREARPAGVHSLLSSCGSW